MKRKWSVLHLLLLVQIVFTACTREIKNNKERETPTKPNIILIMADDLGYNDLGCYGNDRIKTPNIDALARTGIRFTDYHSNGAVCSPTRAALMTGNYQQRAGIEGVVTAKNHRHTGLAHSTTTLAEYLSGQGYKTAITGKWHLGYDTAFSPTNHGFDYFKGFVSGNVDYHSHIDQEGHYDWWLNKDTVVEEGYSTDLITKAGIDFISDNKDNPFFLYMAHEAPHFPYQGRNDPADRTIIGEFDNLGSREDREGAYKEMIEAMDEGIGVLVKYLEDQQLLENTLIIFCSDNGAAKVGSNLPLSGLKGSVWEGGHRVPAIASWKGQIQPGVSDETVLSMDIFPTMAQLVNEQALSGHQLDGRSFLSLIRPGNHQQPLPERPFFWRFKKGRAVRLGQWKYLRIDTTRYLFDLSADISEEKNLLDDQGLMTDSLSNLLESWEKEMDRHEMRTE
ncbi:MAG: sulfatase-like hydrolase/transferase [Cyclobacteriaceae bacterium]|nr:sulfatase-like hydrolase/transferase [Cyclobacteriaceae bacterium]